MALDFNDPNDEPILAIVVHRRQRKGRRILITPQIRDELAKVKGKKTIDDVITGVTKVEDATE